MENSILGPSRITTQFVSDVGVLEAGATLLKVNGMRGLPAATSIGAVLEPELASGAETTGIETSGRS